MRVGCWSRYFAGCVGSGRGRLCVGVGVRSRRRELGAAVIGRGRRGEPRGVDAAAGEEEEQDGALQGVTSPWVTTMKMSGFSRARWFA